MPSLIIYYLSPLLFGKFDEIYDFGVYYVLTQIASSSFTLITNYVS